MLSSKKAPFLVQRARSTLDADSLKSTLEKLARDDKRTLASYIELVLEEHVTAKKGRGKRK